jgi:hypothetical protein
LCWERATTPATRNCAEHPGGLQERIGDQLAWNSLFLYASYDHGSQDDDYDYDSNSGVGGGSQDEDFDPASRFSADPPHWMAESKSSEGAESSSNGTQDGDCDSDSHSCDGTGSKNGINSGAGISDNAAAALPAGAEDIAGVMTEVVKACAEKVAKHRASAAAGAAKQRGAAAATKELKQAIAAKHAGGMVAIQEALLIAGRERSSLNAPFAEQAPHLDPTATPRSSGPAKPPRYIGTGYGDEYDERGHAHDNGIYGPYAHGPDDRYTHADEKASYGAYFHESGGHPGDWDEPPTAQKDLAAASTPPVRWRGRRASNLSCHHITTAWWAQCTRKAMSTALCAYS